LVCHKFRSPGGAWSILIYRYIFHVYIKDENEVIFGEFDAGQVDKSSPAEANCTVMDLYD